MYCILVQARLLSQPMQQSDLLAATAPRAELLRRFGEIASTAEYASMGVKAFPSPDALRETELKLQYAHSCVLAYGRTPLSLISSTMALSEKSCV